MSRTRIVRGKISEVVGGDLRYYSEANIIENATDIYSEKSAQTILHNGNPEKPSAGEIKAKCLVQFRPHDKYKDDPCFGFDWLRAGDSGQKGDHWFGSIMGRYFEEATFIKPFANTNGWTQDKKNNPNGYFKKELSMYDKKLKSYKSFSLSWKKVSKKPFLYPIPTLTLLKGNSALFNLKIEIQEKPKKLTFEFQNKEAEKYLTLNIKEIGDIKKGAYDKFNYFKITCKKSFDKEHLLYVKADGEICGAMRIHPNSKTFIRTIKVLFVKVKTDVNGVEVTGEPATDGYDFFVKNMNQALVKPHFEEIILNCKSNLLYDTFKNKFCTNDAGVYKVTKDKGLKEYFERELKSKFGSKYSGYFTLFFVGEKGAWNGFAFPATTFGVYFNGHNKATIAHEAMHAMRLPHTFASVNQKNLIRDYTYEATRTNNLMDYSHVAKPPIERFCTYKWQWKVLNNKIIK